MSYRGNNALDPWTSSGTVTCSGYADYSGRYSFCCVLASSFKLMVIDAGTAADDTPVVTVVPQRIDSNFYTIN